MNLLPSVDKLTAHVIPSKGLGKVVAISLQHTAQYAISRYEWESYSSYCREDEAMVIIKERVARELWGHLYGETAAELHGIKGDLMNCIAREHPFMGLPAMGLADLRARIDTLIKALETPPPVE